jgi:hypothetical protein
MNGINCTQKLGKSRKLPDSTGFKFFNLVGSSQWIEVSLLVTDCVRGGLSMRSKSGIDGSYII